MTSSSKPPVAEEYGLPKMQWPPAPAQLTIPQMEPISLLKLQKIGSDSFSFAVARGKESWTLDIPKKEMKSIYFYLLEELGGQNKLPLWPKSKLIEFSSYKQEKAEAQRKCLSCLGEIIEGSRAVGGSNSVQTFFGRRRSANEPPASGMLYFSVVSLENVGTHDLPTNLRLSLMAAGIPVLELEDPLKNYQESLVLYREYNVPVGSHGSQLLRVEVVQTLKSKAPTSVSSFELCIAALQPYQNYHLRLPVLDSSPTLKSSSFMNVRACFVPMSLLNALLKGPKLTKLNTFRIQPQKVYYGAGEVIRGTIHFTCASRTAVECIAVRFFSTQHVQWSETSGSGDNATTTVYSETRNMLNDARLVWRPSIASSRFLEAGFHTFPFEIGVPDSAPSTAQYGLQAVITLPDFPIISTTMILFINGPLAPAAATPGETSCTLELKKCGTAVITFPSYVESYQPFPMSLLLKSGFSDPKAISLILSFKTSAIMFAEGSSSHGGLFYTRESVVELRSLPPPDQTKEGLVYKFSFIAEVEAGCDRDTSPLIKRDHEIKLKLTRGKDALVKEKASILVYQSRNILPTPTTFYPIRFKDIPASLTRGQIVKSLIEKGLSQSGVQLYDQVSAVSDPSSWTIDYPDPSSYVAAFPAVKLLHAPKMEPLHQPSAIPAVSIFHFGTLTDGYPALAPLPSTSTSNG